MKATCLNCGYKFKVIKKLKDELGNHAVCPFCESSFDIEVISNMGETMTVEELMNELNKIENKKLPVFGYIINGDSTLEVVPITMVDSSISDRVDINFEVAE